jgi:chaperone modulatory protein CbpM
MNLTLIEWVWLDASETMTLDELSSCCGLDTDDLQELVEYSALVPLQPATQPPSFSAEWVTPLRTAGKLRSDFDLDLFCVALLLGHLNRIDTLERQVKSLQALVPAHTT